MTTNAPAMAAIPGDAAGWPAGPESEDAGPAATLTPVAASGPDAAQAPQPAPVPWGEPPPAFGSGTAPTSSLTAHAGHAAPPGTDYPAESSSDYPAESSSDYPVEPGGGYADEPSTGYTAEQGTGYADEHDGRYTAEPDPRYPAEPSTGYTAEQGTGYADEHDGRYAAEPGPRYPAEPSTGYAAESDRGYAQEAVPDYPWGAATAGLPPQMWVGYGWADEDVDPPGRAAAVRAAAGARPPAVPVADPFTGPVDQTERAAIGDKLRAPGVWCELSPCVSHHIDPTALGVADVRERAIEAGWRHDALGRLACPGCQQTDTRFRGTLAVVRWERDTAITMASLMVAGFRETQRGPSAFSEESEETAVIPVFPAAVIPPGSSQASGPPVRDAWRPS